MTKRLISFVIAFALLAAGYFVNADAALKIGIAPSVENYSVSAQDLRLVCPGAAIVSGGSSGTAVGEFARTGKSAVLGSSQGKPVAIESLDGSGNYVSNAAGAINFSAGLAATVSRQAEQQGSAALNAASLQAVSSPRLNGLMAASCQAASTDIWLLGGDTSTGRETLVLISNPSAVDANVSLDAIGLGGAKQSSSGISVPAHGSQIVPLSSILPETKSLVVHLQSRGSAVAAWLQQRTIRGLNYAGADWVSPSAAFGTELQIPGIFLRGTKDGRELAAKSADYFDVVPTLRIYNPSNKSISFIAQVFGATDKTFGTTIQDTIPANSVQDFNFPILEDGDYVAFVKADEAIIAAVRLPRVNKTKNPNNDFAWLPSAQVVTASQAITVPATGINKLALSNSSKQAVSVTVGSNSISLAPNSTRVIEVTNGKTLRLETSGQIAAALICDVAGAVANIPLVSYQNSGSQVGVLVR